MAAACPLNFNLTRLRDQVRTTYEQVARDPGGPYHFHRGAEYAQTFLGYDPEELTALPALSTERFAGVGNPLAIGPLAPGMTVLDHACGAGTDLLIAARRIGPAGRAIGVDMTPAMVECATTAAQTGWTGYGRGGPPGLLRSTAGRRCQRGCVDLQRRVEPLA